MSKLVSKTYSTWLRINHKCCLCAGDIKTDTRL